MGKLFGTDGMRGTANVFPMTPEMSLRVGKAVAHVFRNCSKGKCSKPKFVIGKDTRISGYMFENALTAGLVSMGADVVLVGPMPTPAIAHLTKSLNANAGIVISASHNPAEDNGIKIFSGDGFKLPDDIEEEIEKHLLDRDINAEHIKAEMIGKATRVNDARGRYIEFSKNSIGNMSLNKIKVVLDCANGAAYSVAPSIFEELGAEVVVLNNTPDGLNINKNCGAMHPEKMQETVKKNKADLGIALDGDADRVIVCDEKGNNVDGDRIIAISAIDLKEKGKLKNNTVVATVMANKGFEVAMKERNIKVVSTKVGDRYVIEEMRKNNYNLGGEQSGHIIFLDEVTTGDGIISGLQILRIMKETGKSLSELAKCMKTFPQTLINIDVKKKPEIETLKNVSVKIKEIEKKLGETGRLLVRYSGTQNICRVMIEGKNKKEIEKYAKLIADAIKKEIGV